MSKKTYIVLSALVLASACSKKTPNELPPPPAGSSSGSQQDGFGSGLSGEDSREALRREFISQAGSDTVYFNTDSYSIDQQSRAILDAQARWLLSRPNLAVTIEGHADERGTREYNLALGERRANAAKNYLASRGIPVSRMTVVSWGKERPAALGSDESSWSRNRRAVTVLPAGY